MAGETAPRLGAQLKRYRRAAGLTQEELAEAAGLSVETISLLEREAQGHSPRRDTLGLLAGALGLQEAERTALEAAARRMGRAGGPRAEHGGSAGTPEEPTPARVPGSGATDSASAASVPAVQHNLPVPLTPFIGRAQQVRRLVDLVRAGAEGPRLVSLVGAAGTGKTRLALHIARLLWEEAAFPDGVFFVSLAALGAAALVPATLAVSLGVPAQGAADPLARLGPHLRDRHLLLVLDNLEHLLPAAAAIAALLEGSPRLRVVVTSRVPLGVYGEREVVVPPLALPDLSPLPPLEQLAGVEAVRLFVARARDVAPDFVLTTANARPVAAICVRLDGLPLALELAATRCKVLTPAALLARLDQRLPLLVGGARTLPARHQTLRAAISWSTNLLSPGEQLLFRRLGIFAGGCTVPAAQAIGALPPQGAAADLAMLDGLTALVNHNLLQPEQTAGVSAEPRFVMLETIREYALERLAASGERARVAQHHARYFAALAATVPPQLSTAATAPWLPQLAREQHNLRAALDWLVAAEEAEQSVLLAGVLGPYWLATGALGEVQTRLSAVLALPALAAATAERARLLDMVAKAAHELGESRRARQLLEESVGIWRRVGDARALAEALSELAHVAGLHWAVATAQCLFAESVALWRASGDHRGLARTLIHLGDLTALGDLTGRHDPERGRAHFEESLHLSQEAGDRVGAAWARGYLGDLATLRGDHAAARACFDDGLATFSAVDDRWRLNMVRIVRARLALAEGDLATARTFLSASVVFWRDAQVQGVVPSMTLTTCAWLAALQGNGARALRLLAAAEQGVPGHPLREWDTLPPGFYAALERAAGALTPEEQARHGAAGRALDRESALAEALA